MKFLLIMLAGVILVGSDSTSSRRKCVGSVYCRACKNCTVCKYCNSGGGKCGKCGKKAAPGTPKTGN